MVAVAGGSLDSKEFVPNMELLMKLNVNSALTGASDSGVATASDTQHEQQHRNLTTSPVSAARIGAKYLKDDGFVVLTGAAAALEGRLP